MKPPDFIEATHAIERVEVTRVARGELACLQITAAQICVAKRFRALPDEKVKSQPAPVSLWNALGLSEKGDEQQQDKVCIDLRLQLEIAGKIFRCDLARAAFELKRSVQRMIKFFDEHDQRPDIAIA